MKEKNFSINRDSNSVRCRIMTEEDIRCFDRVILCTHGFGGSKDASNITRFAEKDLAKHKSDAVVAFDWPCHGQDAHKKLELSDCSEYLTLAVQYAGDTLGAKEIFNYSVSFGGYLTLKYIAEKGCPFAKTALRAPAIRMYDLMRKHVRKEGWEKLQKGKEVEIGFQRKMKADRSFFEDLAAGDIRKFEYFDWADSMIVLHGTADETVPIGDSRQFCEDNVIEFVPVEGADHSFHNPKLMDAAIHRIVEFFS